MIKDYTNFDHHSGENIIRDDLGVDICIFDPQNGRNVWLFECVNDDFCCEDTTFRHKECCYEKRTVRKIFNAAPVVGKFKFF